MATSSSNPSGADLVLGSIDRLGIGVREIFRHAGVEPNNALQHLVRKGRITSVRRALPQGRAYYLPRGVSPLAARALNHRLAQAWFCLVHARQTLALREAEVRLLLGMRAPSGMHVLTKATGSAKVLQLYVPTTRDVAAGVIRMVERSSSSADVVRAMGQGYYGFAVLLPWLSQVEQPLRQALRGESVPGFADLARRGPLQEQAPFEVARVPCVETLALALKDLRGES